jgi:hypothetical protein
VKRKASFCEQKEAKNFFKLGRAGFAVTGPAKQEFFAPLFFKKAATFLSTSRSQSLGDST